MRFFFKQFISLNFSLFLIVQISVAQQGVISGTISGDEGVLQGATITIGTVTTFSNGFGKFSVVLSAGRHMLDISHIGYKGITQLISIENGHTVSLTFTMLPEEKIGQVVVLGSRSSLPRNNLLAPVPVDVISIRNLLQTGQTSLTQMLQFTAPSFNASRQVVNEPFTLRGLDPDQVLILVNGKRYHNMSFVNFGGVRGILGRGAVSNDLNSIPFSAIEKVEILKDGAAAQYGSDAIAGVINIQLKNSIGKTWVHLHTGEFYKGDGENVSLGINRGFAIGKKGFLIFAGSYRFQNPTYRGGRYNGSVYTANVPVDDSIVKAKNFDRHNVSNAGASKHNGFTVSMNGSYQLSKSLELFMVTLFNHRTTIYASGYTFPRNASRINDSLFPNGFKARPGNHTNDVWNTIGIKARTKNKWDWELASTYGNNTANYYNKETNNASQYFSLGINAPTTFYTGSLIYGQWVNGFNATKKSTSAKLRSTNIGWGAEWRLEHFQIKAGEEASWNNFDITRRKQGGSGGLVFSPYDAIRTNRNVLAGYADIESEFANRFLIDLAGRYEYYSDFGSNLAGKLALRYKLTGKLNLRASISNGFRAPSLQQRYYSFTRLGIPNGAGDSQLFGIFRNNSDVAIALGIPSLQAERSINISSGFTAAIHKNIRLTADAYWIQIKNRIVLSGTFDRRNSGVDSLLQGITNVDQVQLFVNAINTRTKGIDVILQGNWKIKQASLLAMLACNFTQTHLFGDIKVAGNLKADSIISNTLFDRAERGKLEKGQPQDKIIFSLQYKTKMIGLTIRNTRFGKTSILASDLSMNDDENFSPKILTDMNLGYTPATWLTVTFGVNNIFNVYPDRLKDYRNTGDGIYIYGMEATPFGFNGGYYFISVELKL